MVTVVIITIMMIVIIIKVIIATWRCALYLLLNVPDRRRASFPQQLFHTLRLLSLSRLRVSFHRGRPRSVIMSAAGRRAGLVVHLLCQSRSTVSLNFILYTELPLHTANGLSQEDFHPDGVSAHTKPRPQLYWLCQSG